MKLNLGCGKKHEEGYINIDIQEPCDLKHDLRTPLPFDNNSVDEVYTEDFIRILSFEEWKKLKKEISRVLKIGGKLEIITPDFEAVFREFLNTNDVRKRDWLRRIIFGDQKDKYSYCNNAFTYLKLLTDLIEEGMLNFTKVRLEEPPNYIHFACYKQSLTDYKQPYSLKILIGTPIHHENDSAIKKWLENVSMLTYPTDLLLVDSSPGLGYIEKVKGYCTKHGIKDYKIEHLEIDQEQGADERIGRSREIIRQYILSHDIDAWFSWECDQIIPSNALDILVGLAEERDFAMVSAIPRSSMDLEVNFGCSLINRKCLKKYGFLLEYPNMPDTWHNGGYWFKKRLLEDGGRFLEARGIINSMYL